MQFASQMKLIKCVEFKKRVAETVFEGQSNHVFVVILVYIYIQSPMSNFRAKNLSVQKSGGSVGRAVRSGWVIIKFVSHT